MEQPVVRDVNRWNERSRFSRERSQNRRLCATRKLPQSRVELHKRAHNEPCVWIRERTQTSQDTDWKYTNMFVFIEGARGLLLQA